MAEKIKGVDVVVYIGNVPVGCEDTSDIEISTSSITTTSKCDKDSSGVLWETNLPNINTVKFTGSGMVPFSTSAGYDEFSLQQLALAAISQQKIYITWGIQGTNLYYGMDGYLTTVKGTAAFNDVVKYNWTVNGTGKITTHAIS